MKLKTQDTNLANRALAAYYRDGGMIPPQEPIREIILENRRRFVVLENKDDILAVYRIRPSDGGLRRVAEWPEEITLMVRLRQTLLDLEALAKEYVEDGMRDRDMQVRLLTMLVALPNGTPRPDSPYIDKIIDSAQRETA